jgi:hypothetical protein
VTHFCKIPLILVFTALSACTTINQSRLNPLNWFGSGDAAPVVTADQPLHPLVPAAAQLGETDQRGLISEVTQVRVIRTANGALVQATGRSVAPGAYNAELVQTGRENGRLTFAFRVDRLATGSQIAATQSQEIIAVQELDTNELFGIRQIAVQSASGLKMTSR